MPTMNPLLELQRHGQSAWLDYLRRSLIESGGLETLIREDGLRGVTSNPTIFEKAINGSSDYDEAIREMASRRPVPDPPRMVEELVVDDIRRTADLFLPVWESLDGADGFVSLEVAPRLAYDTERTVAEAHRLAGLVDRPNLLIKVPGTRPGLQAIELLIADGISVNVTLLFSRDRYREVIEAYLRGLERRADQGLPLSRIASVASFFVSRIDTAVDTQIEARMRDSGDGELKALLGKIAVANGHLASVIYRDAFASEPFDALREKGARPQRLLWASTGTKNPAYSNILYVENLIGPGTINTMTPQTIDAFRDHGRVSDALAAEPSGSARMLETLERHGISLAAITEELETQGVKLFADSWQALWDCTERKTAKLKVA